MQKFESELAPQLAAHEDAGFCSTPKLFARVNDLYERRLQLGLEPESVQLLLRYHTQFVRAGARLNDVDKSRLKAIQRADVEPHDLLQAECPSKRPARAPWWSTPLRSWRGELSAEQIRYGRAGRRGARPGGEMADHAAEHDHATAALAQFVRSVALRERLFKASTARARRSGAADNTKIVAAAGGADAPSARRWLGYRDHATYQLEA